MRNNRKSTRTNNLKGLKNKDWVRKGLQNDDLTHLEKIFDNFDIQKTGKIDGRKLYQAFKALNMQKRSPDVFDIVCKIAKVDKPINLDEFIDLIGETIGNVETKEGGEVVFDRICTNKYIWKKEDKQVPKDLLNQSGMNQSKEDSEIDEDEERDHFETNMKGFDYEEEDDLEYKNYNEIGIPQLTVSSFGLMTVDLGKNLQADESDELFQGANDGNTIMQKDTFMELFEKKLLTANEVQKKENNISY